MNATISSRTTVEAKTKAQKIAQGLGMNLNADIREEPNAYLINSLKQSEKDTKAGKAISFTDGKKAIDYVDSLIKHDHATHS